MPDKKLEELYKRRDRVNEAIGKNDLYKKRDSIEEQIKKREFKLKKDKAKKEGRISDRLADIVCDEHGRGVFRADEKPHSLLFSQGYAAYECRSCIKENKIPSKAYHCKICGYVKGEPTDSRYNDIGILSGSEGVRHICRECGGEVGRTVYRVS